MKEFIQTFKRWDDFGTRSTRREFWSSVLIDLFINFFLLFTIVFQLIVNLNGNLDTFEIANYPVLFSFAIIFLLYNIIRQIPRTALKVRRLHDVGRSGLILLIGLFPFFGFIALIVFYCMPSQPEVNKWGSSAEVVGKNNVFSKNKDNSNRFSKGYESLGSMN
jgi:uncharacterized membrane protein YhaH (DUF805 family)